jgi:outer membrane murein-binding lipoprotein Lpp
MMKTNNKVAVTAVIAASVAALGTVSQSVEAKGHTAASSASALEARLNAMESEMQALRSELAAAKAETAQQVTESAQKAEQASQVAQQTQQQVTEAEKHDEEHHSLLFFRGGYTSMAHPRNNELLLQNQILNPGIQNGNTGEGWYVGAGFDHDLTDDLWGLTDMVEVDGEVMFQYMNFGTSANALVANYTANAFPGGGGATTINVENQLTQFTLAASPKMKFKLMDGDLRPWIIPFGLSINVISPPSSGVTVLNPGLMLGTGIEYRIWKNLWAGADFRYNFTGNDLNYRGYLPGGTPVLNRTNTDGLMAGGYLGFGF